MGAIASDEDPGCHGVLCHNGLCLRGDALTLTYLTASSFGSPAASVSAGLAAGLGGALGARLGGMARWLLRTRCDSDGTLLRVSSRASQ